MVHMGTKANDFNYLKNILTNNSKKLTKWLENTLPKTRDIDSLLMKQYQRLVKLIPSEIIQKQTRLYIKDNKKPIETNQRGPS